MFERYHEKSRRIIFFARFEASQWGDTFINPNHLLLALAREERALLSRFKVPVDDIAAALGLRKPEALGAAHGDLPLDQDARQILLFAVEEADQSGQQMIAPVHLLRGLLRQPCQASAFLKKFVELETLRGLTVPDSPPPAAPLMNEKIMGDLRGQFNPLASALKPEMEPAVTYKLERPR